MKLREVIQIVRVHRQDVRYREPPNAFDLSEMQRSARRKLRRCSCGHALMDHTRKRAMRGMHGCMIYLAPSYIDAHAPKCDCARYEPDWAKLLGFRP